MKNKLFSLDIFRIAAAFIVMLFHSSMHIGCTYGIFQPFISMGAVFMTGFFMLSGYLLYYIYESKNYSDIKEITAFYVKRAIGILPLYYIVSILYIIIYGTESLLQNIILAPVEILAMQSVFTSLFPFSHNSGTWFISCIIICYIIFPLIQTIIKQLSIKINICLLTTNIIILLYAPIVVWMFNLSNIYSNPFFRCLEFMVGILLSSIAPKVKHKFIFRKVMFKKTAVVIEFLVMMIGISALYINRIQCDNYMLYSWICLPIFCLMLPALAISDWRSVCIKNIIIYLSELSYAYFLAQFFVWPLILKVSPENNLSKISYAILLCLIFSILLYEIIQKPLKKYLTKKYIKN